MKSETRRLNRLTGASRSVAKRYKLTTAAAEIIDQAGEVHGQKSRAVQIAVEILWRAQQGRLGKVPSEILRSRMTAQTYKIPQRTVTLIEALGRVNGRTRGEVLAACAGLLLEDVREARKEAVEKLERTLDSFRPPRDRPPRPSR
jgi:hypothetical protein